jgi:hypothetical protein
LGGWAPPDFSTEGDPLPTPWEGTLKKAEKSQTYGDDVKGMLAVEWIDTKSR